MHIFGRKSSTCRSTGIFGLCGKEISKDEKYLKNINDARINRVFFEIACTKCLYRAMKYEANKEVKHT